MNFELDELIVSIAALGRLIGQIPVIGDGRLNHPSREAAA